MADAPESWARRFLGNELGSGTELSEPLKSMEGRNPEEFLDFLRTIPIEALLQDRPAQAALASRE